MSFLKRFEINRTKKKLKALQQDRLNGQASDEALQKEIGLYHSLANTYKSLQGSKKFPFAREQALEALRVAASLDDVKAQYLLGKEMIDEAKERDAMQVEGLFNSQSNEERIKHLYKEGLAYIVNAAKMRHVQAIRLHGLCYINGWGVEQDRKKGFELIITSIDEENGWDKVPQIFAEIGLNKPEFFAALTQFRNKG